MKAKSLLRIRRSGAGGSLTCQRLLHGPKNCLGVRMGETYICAARCVALGVRLNGQWRRCDRNTMTLSVIWQEEDDNQAGTAVGRDQSPSMTHCLVCGSLLDLSSKLSRVISSADCRPTFSCPATATCPCKVLECGRDGAGRPWVKVTLLVCA